jgi:hypothetical protein
MQRLIATLKKFFFKFLLSESNPEPHMNSTNESHPNQKHPSNENNPKAQEQMHK